MTYLIGFLVGTAATILMTALVYHWRDKWRRRLSWDAAAKDTNSKLIGNSALHTKLCHTPTDKAFRELERRVTALERAARVY